jgi:hypothetical protein
MLLVYLEPLVITQTALLNSWSSWVHYWPRSWAHTDAYNAAIPTDWYMLFNNPLYAHTWILRYPDHTRVIRTLD